MSQTADVPGAAVVGGEIVGSSIFRTEAAALPLLSVAKTMKTSSLTPGALGSIRYGLVPGWNGRMAELKCESMEVWENRRTKSLEVCLNEVRKYWNMGELKHEYMEVYSHLWKGASPVEH